MKVNSVVTILCLAAVIDKRNASTPFFTKDFLLDAIKTPPSDRRPLRERLMVLRKSLNNFRQDLRQYDQSSSTVGQKAAAEIDREPAVATTGEGSSQKGNASKVIVNTSHDYCEDYADCPYDDLWSECQSYD